MPKQKTRSAVAKRFSVTGSGKVKFKRACLRHQLSHRRASVKAKLRHAGYVFDGDMDNVIRNLPYGS